VSGVQHAHQRGVSTVKPRATSWQAEYQSKLAMTCLICVYSSTAYIDRSFP
jgi:hypothetical protein